MPVHHRLRFLTFPMRTSRLCSLWPDMRPLRFRRAPFGRDVAFDPGGATASRIAMPHMLPSTVPSVSASAKFFLSWLNPTPHPITVYASHPPSPTTAQHSLPGGALPPYRGRSFTGRNASASPDAPEPEVRIHLPPAKSPVRTDFRRRIPSDLPFRNPEGRELYLSGLAGRRCAPADHRPRPEHVDIDTVRDHLDPSFQVWEDLLDLAGERAADRDDAVGRDQRAANAPAHRRGAGDHRKRPGVLGQHK